MPVAFRTARGMRNFEFVHIVVVAAYGSAYGGSGEEFGEGEP